MMYRKKGVIDSGRLLRALIMGVTLLICLWALTRLESRRAVPARAPVDTTHAREAAPAQEKASVSDPAIDVRTLPFVALDNTCYYNDARDLSRCTETLSGSPAQEYRIAITEATKTLSIEATPTAELFDVSLALFSSDERCIVGQDDHGTGLPERAVVSGLVPGQYLLVVGGYYDNCGPYQLTVQAESPDFMQVVNTEVLAGRNGRVVSWETFAEVGVRHYVLYRTQGDLREQIAVLRAHGSPAGFATYRITDRMPTPDGTYEIEAVAWDGRTQWVSVTT